MTLVNVSDTADDCTVCYARKPTGRLVNARLAYGPRMPSRTVSTGEAVVPQAQRRFDIRFRTTL